MNEKCMCCNAKFNFINPKIALEDIREIQVCPTCYNHIESLIKYANMPNEYHYNNELNFLNSKAQSYEPIFKDYIEKLCKECELTIKEKFLKLEELRSSEPEKTEEEKILEEKYKSIIITTSFNLEGYRINKYINVISSESVLDTGILTVWNGEGVDFWEIESNSKIDTARKYATDRLIYKAISINANAIIGLSYDYIKLATNMIAVTVTGTAVDIAIDDSL